jgi:methionyl-tRNA synthetase
LNAHPDFFIRTSDEGHKSFVREFLQRIYDNGDVYEDVYSGLYCVGCEEFKSESDLVDGKCPVHGTVPERIEEKNYFFRLSAYQDKLLELYDTRPDFVLPQFRFNEARSFIAGGLQDFSISRAGEPWGIPLPWDESQVAYVWADALVNYLSALTYARPGEDLRPVFWPEVRHLMAKDILRFHCVYWPAMLLAAGYDVPKQIFVHGYLLLDERKISKSLGNILDPLDLIDVYGTDAVRYWCARAVNFGQDGSASVDGLHERYERELGNDLGNLLSRTTKMIEQFLDGKLESGIEADDELRAFADALRRDAAADLDRFEITAAIDRIWELVRWLNRYVTEQKPWEIAKDDARRDELTAVLHTLADGLRISAVALASYLPVSAARILDALGQPGGLEWDRVAAGRLEAASSINGAEPLFPRIEAPAAA